MRHQEPTAPVPARVSGLMHGPPLTVAPGLRADEALAIAERHGVHYLLVVSSGRLLGVVAACSLRRIRGDTPIRTCLKAPPLTIDEGESTAAAVALMESRGVGCLPVLRGGEAIGVVTVSDLRRAAWAPDGGDDRACMCCGGFHDLRPAGAAWFCVDCLEGGRPARPDDELGGED